VCGKKRSGFWQTVSRKGAALRALRKEKGEGVPETTLEPYEKITPTTQKEDAKVRGVQKALTCLSSTQNLKEADGPGNEPASIDHKKREAEREERGENNLPSEKIGALRVFHQSNGRGEKSKKKRLKGALPSSEGNTGSITQKEKRTVLEGGTL